MGVMFGAVKDAIQQATEQVIAAANTAKATAATKQSGNSGSGSYGGFTPAKRTTKVTTYDAKNRSSGNMGSITTSEYNGPGPIMTVLGYLAKPYEEPYHDFIDNPTPRTFMNWLTGGLWDRAFHNPNPLSLDHWLSTLGLVSWGTSVGKPVYTGMKFRSPAENVALTTPQALVQQGQTAVIGKMKDLNTSGNVVKGEFKVADYLPNLGNPKANWKQNSGVLRSIMNEGSRIKDVSMFPMDNAGFLGAERNLLQSKGWIYFNGYWYPSN